MWVTREKYNRRNLHDYSGVEARASFSKLISDCKVAYLQSIHYLNPNEILIHVDYTENYKNKDHREIKFAFQGQGQFILFAACIYHRDTDEVNVKTLFMSP